MGFNSPSASPVLIAVYETQYALFDHIALGDPTAISVVVGAIMSSFQIDMAATSLFTIVGRADRLQNGTDYVNWGHEPFIVLALIGLNYFSGGKTPDSSVKRLRAALVSTGKDNVILDSYITRFKNLLPDLLPAIKDLMRFKTQLYAAMCNTPTTDADILALREQVELVTQYDDYKMALYAEEMLVNNDTIVLLDPQVLAESEAYVAERTSMYAEGLTMKDASIKGGKKRLQHASYPLLYYAAYQRKKALSGDTFRDFQFKDKVPPEKSSAKKTIDDLLSVGMAAGTGFSEGDIHAYLNKTGNAGKGKLVKKFLKSKGLDVPDFLKSNRGRSRSPMS
jgi:hypothetical protein